MRAPSPLVWQFNDPRLNMTAAGRFFVRAVANVTASILSAGAVVCVLTDVRWVRPIGILIVLFLLDRVLHAGKSDKSIMEVRGGSVNAAHYLAPQSFRAIEAAYDIARASGGNFFIILLRVLERRGDVRHGLLRLDIKEEDFADKLDEYIKESSRMPQSFKLDDAVFFVVTEAARVARFLEGRSIEPKDIFSAVMRAKDPTVMNVMSLMNIEEGDLENALLAARLERRTFLRPSQLGRMFRESRRERHRVMNRAWTARPTPFLDRVSNDLTDNARSGKGGVLIGHEREYDMLVDILSKGENPNALLIGDPGSGKDAIIARLAYQIVKDRVPPPLFDKRLVALSLGELISGAGEGELAERLEHIVREIAEAGNIILYIPDIHNLLKSGGKLALSAADILIPAIQGTGFSVIGSTYPREYKQFIEPASDFASTFANIRVNELSESEATRLLVLRAVLFERDYRSRVSFTAIKRAVRLAHKYLRDKLLPGSAEDIIKEALADAAEHSSKIVSAEDITNIVERKVNIPLHNVEALEARKLLDLESVIHERYVGQDEAVGAVSRAVREYRSGLARKGGPIASFLFVGPTGVGKTELAKILTRIQFGDEKLIHRFDMSEYQDKTSFFRFIGSPDGNVTGSLTEAVSQMPYSLVLLDEFEKAHPDIFNLFLQVFDEGRLTDNMGRVVSFENTIIIATSNAHSDFIKSELERGAPIAEIAEELKQKLTTYFKPELLNRFSDIIVFKPLSPQNIKAITGIALKELSAVLRENQGIELQWDASVVDEISRLGYDPVFGARPLRKVISEKIRGVLAEKILKNEIARGATVTATVDGGKFVIT
jgi:ATP-dependent Clp protease ATP-binding subunit ClpC